ncbi:hypothetical protein KVV02_008728 [Mortierella alpina]|uniref:N-acetyltransferase domain-containing protein n=1 Tax=Mortierella alpina TaxID=64518 RepID=A0A9P8D260_MORAP|nr:hypothetical protein KVV02_008728 [Mortierella alpina]
MTVPTSTDNHRADTVLVHIPSRPPIRSASSHSSTTSTESSASRNLASGPVQQVIFRHGRVEEAAAMTDMQFSNYRFHYHSILPKPFLDNLDFKQMTAGHVKKLMPPVDKREAAYVVAERVDAVTGQPEIIGMAQSMVPNWERAYNHRFYEGWSQEDFDCEIDTLYVKIGVQGGGIGRKLILGALQEAYDRFQMRRGVIIWTIVENTQARDFYKRIGCEELALRTLGLGEGMSCECVAYGFRTVGEAIGK